MESARKRLAAAKEAAEQHKGKPGSEPLQADLAAAQAAFDKAQVALRESWDGPRQRNLWKRKIQDEDKWIEKAKARAQAADEEAARLTKELEDKVAKLKQDAASERAGVQDRKARRAEHQKQLDLCGPDEEMVEAGGGGKQLGQLADDAKQLGAASEAAVEQRIAAVRAEADQRVSERIAALEAAAAVQHQQWQQQLEQKTAEAAAAAHEAAANHILEGLPPALSEQVRANGGLGDLAQLALRTAPAGPPQPLGELQATSQEQKGAGKGTGEKVGYAPYPGGR